jgi:predicted alpha/beta-fold hydrolase
MAKAFHQRGYNAFTWNYRGCGEEMNLALRFYHSGASDDLECVVDHAIGQGFRQIYLIGFSLGGNLTLKYLGERGKNIPAAVKGAATFSVPLHLDTSSTELSRPSNYLYSRRFLKSLKKKVVDKSRVMAGIDISGIGNIRTLREFDDQYTAPIHGFESAAHYYKCCSALFYLETINVPTLIVNARNDPFLSSDCFPPQTNNPPLVLEYPDRGGHVGFAQFNQNGLYWSEARALRFVKEIAQ